MGPVWSRLRYFVRFHRPAVVRPVRVFRHRRHGGCLSAHGSQLSGRDHEPLHRHDRGRRCRLSGGPDRATAHRHIFRHDHGGDRRSIFLRRIQSALGLHGRRERAAGRAGANAAARLHHAAVQQRHLALQLPGVLVFRRRGDRTAHRAFAGRCHPARHPRQSVARGRRRPQHPQLQADRVRRRCRLCGLRRRPPWHHAGLHAARRVHVRYIRATGDADGDRRRRHFVRPAGRRHGVALSERLPANHPASRCRLEARARHRLCAAGLLPAPRPDRRLQRPLRIGRPRFRVPLETAGYRRPARRGSKAGAACSRHASADAGTAPQERRLFRADSRGDAAHQTLWRPARQQRHQFFRPAGRAARHHRAERRWQDHLLQDADLRDRRRPPARSCSRVATLPA